MKARSNVADSALTQLGNEQNPPNTANPRVATFFARYPDPLGIKDGAYFCVALASMPVRGFGPKVALHVEDGKESIWLDPALMESLIVSIRFHRGRLARNLLMQHDEELMAVLGRVTGSSFPEFRRVPSSEEGTRTESADDESLTSYTIVEMTTQVVKPTETSWQACEPAPGVMGPTLTRCITALIQVVNAYRFAEKVSIPAPARERIGPTITAATRHADPANGGWDSPADYVMNLFASWHQAVLHGTEQPDTMKRMGTYLRLESMDHPSIPSMQVQADLDSAFFHEGNFRATAIFAHSASEVLLDIALMGMLFEEGKSARDAVSHFFNRPLKTRLLTDFHERIGGAWTPSGDHAVNNWLQRVLLLRHRVAHAGYLPSYEEAQMARDAHYALGTHLRDRLARHAKKYPFTAGLLVTKNGFERRGIRTKAADKAVATAEQEIVPFLKWRAEFIQARST